VERYIFGKNESTTSEPFSCFDPLQQTQKFASNRMIGHSFKDLRQGFPWKDHNIIAFCYITLHVSICFFKPAPDLVPIMSLTEFFPHDHRNSIVSQPIFNTHNGEKIVLKNLSISEDPVEVSSQSQTFMTWE